MLSSLDHVTWGQRKVSAPTCKENRCFRPGVSGRPGDRKIKVLPVRIPGGFRYTPRVAHRRSPCVRPRPGVGRAGGHEAGYPRAVRRSSKSRRQPWVEGRMGDTHAWGRDKAGQPDIINSKSDILLLMSAFGSKADVRELPAVCPLIARSGHSPSINRYRSLAPRFWRWEGSPHQESTCGFGF